MLKFIKDLVKAGSGTSSKRFLMLFFSLAFAGAMYWCIGTGKTCQADFIWGMVSVILACIGANVIVKSKGTDLTTSNKSDNNTNKTNE